MKAQRLTLSFTNPLTNSGGPTVQRFAATSSMPPRNWLVSVVGVLACAGGGPWYSGPNQVLQSPRLRAYRFGPHPPSPSQEDSSLLPKRCDELTQGRAHIHQYTTHQFAHLHLHRGARRDRLNRRLRSGIGPPPHPPPFRRLLAGFLRIFCAPFLTPEPRDRAQSNGAEQLGSG